MRWNPSKSNFNLDEYREASKSVYGFSTNISLYDWEVAHKGDKFYTLRLGDDCEGIVFWGVFTSEPYTIDECAGDNYSHYVDVNCFDSIDADEKPILDIDALEEIIPEVNWRSGHNGILLSDYVSRKLDTLYFLNVEAKLKDWDVSIFNKDKNKRGIIDFPVSRDSGKCKIIHLNDPNTLANFLSKAQLKKVVTLIITGFIGRKDFDHLLYDVCDLRHLDLGNAVYVDGDDMPHIGYHPQLETLILPQGIKTTCPNYDYCFSDSETLTSLVLPKGLKTVRGFRDCPNLMWLELPEGLERIDANAFCGCESITSIRIPASVKKMSGSCFAGCNITAYEVDNDNPKYVAIDGVIYTKDLSALVAFPSVYPVKYFKVPEGTEIIGYGAFMFSDIDYVDLPEGLTTINKKAFYYSTVIRIDLPDSVKKVKKKAFYGCTNLKKRLHR